MRLSIALSALILVAVIMPLAYADDPVDLTALPNQLAERLNITIFPARILTSLLFMMIFFVPTLFFTRNSEHALIAVLLVGLGCLGFCVAMGWFPIWLWTLMCLALAFLYAKRILDVMD